MISTSEPHDDSELSGLRVLAESAALLGGHMARAAFGRRQVVTLKSDASEVTEVDVAIERAIVAHIRAARPDDALIGEEGVAGSKSRIQSRRAGTKSKIAWAIDPIDGTRNFIRGVPLFTCSVAAMLHGTPVAAAIYDPIPDTLYLAQTGFGAIRRSQDAEERLRLESGFTPGVRNTTPIVAIPSAWKAASDALVHNICKSSVVRSLGCATLHLTLVATGGVDGAYLNNCKLWDIAAGWLIAIEAGACVTSDDGSPLFPIDADTYSGEEMPLLAGHPQEHQRLTFCRINS